VASRSPKHIDDALIKKISALPRERIAEVADFVDFIAQRDADLALSQAVASLSAPALARVWDNSEDAVYDAL
jgi:hypothetical protein